MWLIRSYRFLYSKLQSHLAASALLGVVPAAILALPVWLVAGGLPLSPGHWIMFGWLSFAPFVVWKADDALGHLIERARSVHGEGVATIVLRCRHRLRSSSQWVFSLPWALVVAVLGTVPVEAPVSDPVTLWVFFMLFYTFLVSGIGFHGIVAVLRMFRELQAACPELDPYASDRIGGFQPFSQLSILATLLFSTGALAFPLVYDIVRASENALLLQYLVFLLTSLYVVAILAVFFGPMFALQDIIARRKAALIDQSNRFLDEQFRAARVEEGEQARVSLERLRTHYDVFHRRLEQVKDYPYDLRILFELVVSLAIPVAVALLQNQFLAG